MNGKLEELTESEFEQVWNIMEQSFPVDERRTREGQKQVLKEPYYRLYGCQSEEKVGAFLAVWEFETFTFVEHFAVEVSCRNGGIGAKLLQQLLARVKSPVILEVEPPAGELQKRRISFYERNGLAYNPYEYVQPAMSPGRNAIPLKIMSFPGQISQAEFENMRDTLYRHVYKVS